MDLIKLYSIEGNTCKEAEEKGAYILHGNRMMFHRSIINFDPAFHTIYEIIQKVSGFDVTGNSECINGYNAIIWVHFLFAQGIHYLFPIPLV